MPSSLADDRCIGTGHGHWLTGFNDVRGLGVIRIAASGYPEAGHRDARHQSDNHNLQVRRAICRMNGVVHVSLLASLAAALLTTELPRACFRRVSRVPQ